ncbi:MAG: IniB N-terminal domain-containing protein [Pseudonocardia sp.]
MQAIIDFLLSVMRDPQARAEFEQNPTAAMSSAGIEGATAQDVRDAQLQMADRGLARSSGGSSSGSGGDDPVQEISYTTRHYEVSEDAPDYITNINNIDDRDITINDSFNSDDDITIIDDSFNKSVENDVTAIQDNDTTVIQDNDTVQAPEANAGVNTGVVPPTLEPEPEPAPESAAEPELVFEEEPAPDLAEPDDTDAAEVDAVV